MKFYSNFKVRTKYFLPVSVIAVGLLLVILYGTNSLYSSSANFVNFINTDETYMLSLSNMYAQGLQSEQATRNVLLNPGDQKAKNNYLQADKDFLSQLEKAKTASAGNSAVISNLNLIEKMWNESDLIKKEIQNEAVAGKTSEAISLLNKSETVKWRKLKQILLGLIAEKNDNISAKKIEVQYLADSSFIKMISFTVLVVILSFILLIFSANSFVKPILTLEENAKKVASGDTDVKVKIKFNDEMGSLNKSFNYMVENIRNSLAETKNKGAIAEAAAKDAEEAKYVTIMQKEYLDKSMRSILTEMDKFAGGDLNVFLKVEKNDEIGRLFSGFNKAVNNIREMIINITQAVTATASAANEISSSTEEMASGIDEQSQQTTEVARSVEEMTKTIMETSRNSSAASDAAKNAGSIAKEGGQVVNETITGMISISDVVKKSAETIQALGKSSEQIGEIIQVINDIADQTNLLAFNAAIEAARAGEQGRGFAVVADEVRKLAESTTKATKEIANMIKQIQKETGGAVQAMNEGTKEVEKGKTIANKAGESH